MFKMGCLILGLMLWLSGGPLAQAAVCTTPGGGTATTNAFGDCVMTCPPQQNLVGDACVFSGAGSYSCGVRLIPTQGLPGGTQCNISRPCGPNRVVNTANLMNDCVCAPGYTESGNACIPSGGGGGGGSGGGTCNVGDRCSNGTRTGTWDGSACCGPPGSNLFCLAPPFTCTRPSPTPTCTDGYQCGPCPRGHVCTFDARNSCCIDTTAQVCLAVWSTCTPPPPPCQVGDRCTNSFGLSGRWTSNSGCCTVDRNGVPTSCLAPPITCSSPTPTPTPFPGCCATMRCGYGATCNNTTCTCDLPTCTDGFACTNQAGLMGNWQGNCCIGGGRGAEYCLAPPITNCTEPASPPSTSCVVDQPCQGRGGQIGIMTRDSGCCTSGPNGMCLSPPYTCPPRGGSGSGTPTATVTASTTTSTTGPGTSFEPPGFTQSGTTWVIVPGLHQCSSLTSSTVASSVATGETFDDFVNRKLKCCMHEVNTTAPYVKYDCVENAGLYTDFNRLWESTDAPGNGGELAAASLFGPGNQPLTGFFRLDGSYCPQFHPYLATAGQLRRYRIDGNQTVVQQNRAAGGQEALDLLATLPAKMTQDYRPKLLARGKSYPTTVADMRSCPILVRAALEIKCPRGGKSAYIDSALPADKVRCVSGTTARFHIRAEQIFEITGQPVMKTVDSVVDNNQLSTISIDQILKSRRGH